MNLAHTLVCGIRIWFNRGVYCMIKKMAYKKQAQSGFTLIELLIALVILAIGLLAAAAMQGTAINSNAFAYRHAEITAVGQMVMDDLLSQFLQATSPPSLFYQQFNPNPLNPAQQIFVYQYNRFPPYNWESNPVATTNYVVPGVGTFQATYTVTTNTPARNISRVQVQIFMLDAAGNAQRVPFNLINYRKMPPST